MLVFVLSYISLFNLTNESDASCTFIRNLPLTCLTLVLILLLSISFRIVFIRLFSCYAFMMLGSKHYFWFVILYTSSAAVFSICSPCSEKIQSRWIIAFFFYKLVHLNFFSQTGYLVCISHLNLYIWFLGGWLSYKIYFHNI